MVAGARQVRSAVSTAVASSCGLMVTVIGVPTHP